MKIIEVKILLFQKYLLFLYPLLAEKNARVGGESPRTIYFYKVLKAKIARTASHLAPRALCRALSSSL